jgi:mono/diheme cytochrome c family protein
MLAVSTNHAAAANPAQARGAATFATHGCAHCHGPAGVGGNIGPDLQQVRKRLTAAQITTQIHDGSKGMPAYGDQLTAPEISDLVVYLRTRRKLVKVPPPQ